MKIEFDTTDKDVNTKYGPLAALCAYYYKSEELSPLKSVKIPIKTREYTPYEKLVQIMLSILSGCEYLAEVNTKLKPEKMLAKVCQKEHFADQSVLSQTLDALTLMNLEQLEKAVRKIWRKKSATVKHDWCGFLWLDYDLSGLPCGPQAEESQRGFFSDKKMRRVVN